MPTDHENETGSHLASNLREWKARCRRCNEARDVEVDLWPQAAAQNRQPPGRAFARTPNLISNMLRVLFIVIIIFAAAFPSLFKRNLLARGNYWVQQTINGGLIAWGPGKTRIG